ncbi:PefC/AfrB family outer membrane usher protein [Edwardsiella tarda]
MSGLKLLLRSSIITLSSYPYYVRGVELNTDFLHGVKNTPAILINSTDFPQGKYVVDVLINNEHGKRTPLFISNEEEQENMLCLSPEWLEQAGILFKKEKYAAVFEPKKNCYNLAKERHTNLQFNYGVQSLEFSIPQAYLLSKTDSQRWDYGSNGARVTYYSNFNKSSNNTWNIYGNFATSINLGRWIMTNNLNLSYANNKTEVTSNDLTFSTAISQVQGDLLLGKVQTRSDLYSDFNFYGVTLRSNSSMRSWNERGYAPNISGIANSTSRITIQQNNYTIYSKVVAPGPYQINDLHPIGNGDLKVTVEDESGHQTVTIYPVDILPTLLRPDEYQYSLALGKKNTVSKLDGLYSLNNGTFLLGSFDYGFNATTINTATILHKKYQSMGLGITQSLGRLGAFSLSSIGAKAKYITLPTKNGYSFNAKYIKSFTDQTTVQLLASRYQSRGYVEFVDFNPNKRDLSSYHYEDPKSRYELRLSHRIDRSYISGSYWRQNYWNENSYDSGATVAFSTYILDDISISINGSYTKGVYANSADYSSSFGISIPFNFGNTRHYSSSSIGYTRHGGISFDSGMSAILNDNVSYSINANTQTDGTTGISGSASYTFNSMQTGIAVSHADRSTSISGSLSGSLIATLDSGLLFTKDTSDTVCVINTSGEKGITFNNSAPTDMNGNTAVWLNEYAENTISINMDNVPDNVEIENTSYNVVPTAGAIIYRKFDFKPVSRYILHIKDKQGQVMSGASATTDNGLNIGFVANNGILLINLVTTPTSINIEHGSGKQCHFSMDGIKGNTNTVQEIVCE